MQYSALGVVLSLAVSSGPAAAEGPERSQMVRGLLQNHLAHNRQLLSSFDSTRRLSPFGDLQVTLLAGGSSMEVRGGENLDLSSGEVRGNGHYWINRYLRFGGDVNLGTETSDGEGSEFSMLSVFASGLYQAWHWDLTASHQSHKSWLESKRVGSEGWSLQGVAGYDLGAANPRWHLGPSMAFTLTRLGFVESALDLTTQQLAAGLFAQFLSRDKTLSLTCNLSLQTELEQKMSGGGEAYSAEDPYLDSRINLTYAPNPLARITLQWAGFKASRLEGQHLLVGAIYHL